MGLPRATLNFEAKFSAGASVLDWKEVGRDLDLSQSVRFACQFNLVQGALRQIGHNLFFVDLLEKHRSVDQQDLVHKLWVPLGHLHPDQFLESAQVLFISHLLECSALHIYKHCNLITARKWHLFAPTVLHLPHEILSECLLTARLKQLA